MSEKLEVKLTLDDKLSQPLTGATEKVEDLRQAAENTAAPVQGAADATTNLGTAGETSAEKIGGAAKSTSELGKNAAEAEEPVRKTGQEAEEAGKKADAASGLLKKAFTLAAVIGLARKAVKEFLESVSRLASEGNPDALLMADSLKKIKDNSEQAQDAIVTKLLPATAKVAENAASMTDGMVKFSAGDWWDVITGNTGAVVDRQVEAGRTSTAMADTIAQAAMTAGDAMAPLAEKSDLVAAALGREGSAAGLTATQLDGIAQAQARATQAAEALALATAGADVGIYLAGQAIDEALAQDAPLTVETFQSLAGALYDTTQNAQELGMQLPEGELQTAREKADKLRDALATMDVPPEMKEALKKYLAEIYSNLNDIGAASDYVNGSLGGMGSVPGGGAPGGGMGAGADIPQNYDSGGVVDAPAGAPVSVTAHGGEVVVNPRDPAKGMQALRRSGLVGGGGGGDIVIHTHIYLNEREIAEAVARYNRR